MNKSAASSRVKGRAQPHHHATELTKATYRAPGLPMPIHLFNVRKMLFPTIHLLNSRTVKVFASCHTVVLRLVIFTLTQKI
jgi:hypothetical protein